MRSPDASANVYLLMAALCVACRHGFSLKDGLEIADSTYVNVNIHRKENAKLLASLATLPDSCWASAETLKAQRAVYEEKGVFSAATIDGTIADLGRSTTALCGRRSRRVRRQWPSSSRNSSTAAEPGRAQLRVLQRTNFIMSSYSMSSSMRCRSLSFTVSSFHFFPAPKLPPSVTFADTYWRETMFLNTPSLFSR